MDIKAYIQSGIVESYVLKLITEEETMEVESLRKEYAELDQSIEEFSVLLEKEAFYHAVAPPSYIKENLMKAIHDDVAMFSNNLKSVVHGREETLSPTSSYNKWQWLLLAASILFIISLVGNVVLYNNYKEKSDAYVSLLNERNNLQASNQIYQTNLQEWQEAAQLLTSKNINLVRMAGVSGRESNQATVLWNKFSNEVYLMSGNLPDPASGKQFQLWAIVNGKPVDAGVLQEDCTLLCKMKVVSGAQAFAITLEKAGGSPVPTLSEMYVYGEI